MFLLPLNSWNVANVTDMKSMFTYASIFNQDLTAWNVGSVTSYGNFRYNALAFEVANLPDPAW